MAIVKPVTAYPNGNTIDMSSKSKFTVQIQGGGSVVTGYSAQIYESSSGQKSYGISKTSLSTPLVAGDTLSIEMPAVGEYDRTSYVPLSEGNEYYWKVRLYQDEPTMYVATVAVLDGTVDTTVQFPSTSIIKAGMYVYVGGQYLEILSYSEGLGSAVINGSGVEGRKTVDIYSNFVESIGFPFTIKSPPTLDILFENAPMSENSCILTSRTGNFIGSYVQAISTDIRWYEYRIYNRNLDEIDYSGKLKNASLKYSFSNFENGNSYYVKLAVMNEDDVLIETSYLPLTVSYTTFSLGSTIDVSTNCDGTMLVEWVEDRLSTGVATGSYTYEELPIPTLFCLTTTGTAIAQVSYKWDDNEVWDDNLYWTEDVVGNYAANILDIISGEVYYDEINGEKIDIDDNDFTICFDVYLPVDASGILLALISDTNVYRVQVADGTISYLIDGTTITTKTYDNNYEAEFKIAILPDRAIIAEQ